MIFDLTRQYVPDSYVDSRDYRVLLRQLGAVSTVFKYNIDHFPDLYNPDECPEHMLPLLATMVGYEYKESKSVESNRKIIKNFPYLIRNRGSMIGIKMAVVLSINTDPNATEFSASHIIIEPRPEEGIINVYYPRMDIVDWDLVEVVRPVGMRINLIQSDVAMLTEEVDIRVNARALPRDQYFDQSVVEESQTGYDTVRVTRDRNKRWDS